MRKKVASAGAASWWWTLEFTAWILVAWGLGLGGAATDLGALQPICKTRLRACV
jgi:hypothetical protein